MTKRVRRFKFRRVCDARATCVVRFPARRLQKRSGGERTPRRFVDGLSEVGCDFTHPFATNGSIHLPEVQRKALFFGHSTIPAERKLNHPFAESAKWKQQLAESTKPVLNIH